LAFLLNYVPNIGSIIAAVPAVIMSFIQFGIGRIIYVIDVYLLVNIIFGSIIEPRVMGCGAGLSTLVVFLSLIIWMGVRAGWHVALCTPDKDHKYWFGAKRKYPLDCSAVGTKF
jgi:hypothetical protein